MDDSHSPKQILCSDLVGRRRSSATLKLRHRYRCMSSNPRFSYPAQAPACTCLRKGNSIIRGVSEDHVRRLQLVETGLCSTNIASCCYGRSRKSSIGRVCHERRWSARWNQAYTHTRQLLSASESSSSMKSSNKFSPQKNLFFAVSGVANAGLAKWLVVPILIAKIDGQVSTGSVLVSLALITALKNHKDETLKDLQTAIYQKYKLSSNVVIH